MKIAKLTNHKNFIFLIIVALFLLVRLYQLPTLVNFSMDQGKTLLNIYNLWQEKKLTLIGPESSLKTAEGLSFFHGPWIYYLLLPFLLLFNWHPLAGSYFFIFINLLALIFLFLATWKKFGYRTALLTSLVFALMPAMIHYSQFLWNPNFLPLVSSLIIFLSIKIINRPGKSLFFFLLGISLGFGLSNHYQAIILIAAVFIIMTLVNQKVINFLSVIVGITIGVLPLIIFESRHNFYNLKILATILRQGLSNSFVPHFYYFLFLIPFFCLLLGIILNKLLKYSLPTGLTAIFCLFLYFLIQIISRPSSGFTMPQGWNYLGIKKTVNIILKENKEDYNIVSLLSGDTLAYPLRYLLVINKKPPLEVNSYPQAKYLFVISQHNDKETANNSVWEISSFCPCKINKSWPVQNNINLYLLEKSSL